MSTLALEPYLAWLLPLVQQAWPDAVGEEISDIQLGRLPLLPNRTRPYVKVQLPIVPTQEQSLHQRWNLMVAMITRYGVYTDTETPLLILQGQEADALIDLLMQVARPFSGANFPIIEQTVFDEQDDNTESAAENTYQTKVVFSLKVSRPILTRPVT